MINYFDTPHAIVVHAMIIDKSGGLLGVKSVGLLESVLELVKNDDYYPEFLDKITHLVYGINKNHAFNDGNKRASIALSSYFLEINNHDFAIKQYTHGMEEVAVWLASSLIDRDQLHKIIHFLIYDDETRIYYFIEEARKYRFFIEKGIIRKELLGKMIACLISEEMFYSDEVTIGLLSLLSAFEESEQI